MSSLTKNTALVSKCGVAELYGVMICDFTGLQKSYIII